MKRFIKKILYQAARLFSRLPFRCLYVVSDMLCPFVSGYRRSIVKRNIDTSFPELSADERRAIKRKYYHFLCDYIVETLKLLTISPAEMKSRMRFEGLDEMSTELSNHPFVFIYLGHYCNWEWISSLPLSYGEGLPCAQLYKPLRDPLMDSLFSKLRTRFGAENIDKNKALRRIMEMKAQGTRATIGFISDQGPRWENIHDWVNFLNQDTPVFTGTERIAKKVDAAVYFGDVRRERRGYYVCRLKKLADNVAELPDFQLTERYMQELEQVIRRAPQYWLWSHNRWKRQRKPSQAKTTTTA